MKKLIKERDFQTLSLFAILAVLTVLFVLGSRLVLFGPFSDQARTERKQKTAPLIELDNTAAKK